MDIYTDGGCWGNPGKGGWAFVVARPEGPIARNGGEAATTNNRMELTAVIRALQLVGEGGDAALAAEAAAGGVDLHTDSQYVQKGITEWIHGWMRNGWKTAAKDPVKNKELWQELWELQKRVKVRWHWVKGHAGNPLNEACDQLVQQAIGKL